MKHLKPYKIFESKITNEHIRDLQDILLELKEDGFNIVFGTLYKNRVNISITKSLKRYLTSFSYDQISDYTERIKDFCEINDFDFNLSKFSPYGLRQNRDENLVRVFIMIKNREVKHYNESMSSEYIEDLKDILLELKDEGFTTDVKFTTKRRDIFRITIYKIKKDHETGRHRTKHIDYNEVFDCTERIKDFCKINNLDCSVIKQVYQKTKGKNYEWIEKHIDQIIIDIKNKD